MGKRSEFPRIRSGRLRTPGKAVAPLLEYLSPRTRFIEPCAGAGHLIGHLEAAGHVCRAYDLPDDARTWLYDWSRRDLHHQSAVAPVESCIEIIVNLSNQAPAWLLIMPTGLYTSNRFHSCRASTRHRVGRSRPWIPGSKSNGKDNCVWAFVRPCSDLVGKINSYPVHGGRTADPATPSGGRHDADWRPIRPRPICAGSPVAPGPAWLLRGQDRLLRITGRQPLGVTVIPSGFGLQGRARTHKGPCPT